MWDVDDDFWLALRENTKNVLGVALGDVPLRITASNPEDDLERDGYLDVKIATFNRDGNEMHVRVVKNTTGRQLKSQLISLKLGELIEISQICPVTEIDGIIF